MYVPEGYPINLESSIYHPEWIMAYKYIGQAVLHSSIPYQPPRLKLDFLVD